jgi:hypothetical protein
VDRKTLRDISQEDPELYAKIRSVQEVARKYWQDCGPSYNLDENRPSNGPAALQIPTEAWKQRAPKTQEAFTQRVVELSEEAQPRIEKAAHFLGNLKEKLLEEHSKILKEAPSPDVSKKIEDIKRLNQMLEEADQYAIFTALSYYNPDKTDLQNAEEIKPMLEYLFMIVNSGLVTVGVIVMESASHYQTLHSFLADPSNFIGLQNRVNTAIYNVLFLVLRMFDETKYI